MKFVDLSYKRFVALTVMSMTFLSMFSVHVYGRDLHKERSLWHWISSSISGQHDGVVGATARFGKDLCHEEKNAHVNRVAKNKIALEKFTKQSLAEDVVPTIGVVCSGGGFRAAVATLGFLQGLEAVGLLDATTYISALSGSTWSLSSWMFHGSSLTDLEAYLRGHLHKAFSFEQINTGAIAEIALAKVRSGRNITLNDVWGGLIGDVFFSTEEKSGQEAYLSDVALPVAAGNYPIPLFTAVFAHTEPDYQWMEFSPFECGSADHGVWVSPDAFGKKFNNGVSTDDYPGENFGYMLGLCGSAYAASGYDVVNAIRQAMEDRFDVTIPSQWFEWMSGTCFGELRISPPKVCNFMRNVPKNPFKDQKNLTIIDAGLAINLPFTPLFRRDIDVFLVCDASSDCLYPGGHTMKQVQQYAHDHGIQLPTIDYQKITSQRLSVIADESNPAAPIIIYVPNFVEISTLDFDYSDDEFLSLARGMKKALIDNAAQIRRAIGKAIDKKLGTKSVSVMSMKREHSKGLGKKKKQIGQSIQGR